MTNYKATFSIDAGAFSTKQTLEEQFLIYYNKYYYCIFRFTFSNNTGTDFIGSTNYIAVMYRFANSKRAVYLLYGGALVEYFYYVRYMDNAFYYTKFSGTRMI